MGCSASKAPVLHPTRNSDHCSSAAHSAHSSPAAARAFSLLTPLIHHPPLKKGDTHHLVSLTSTTYGSLLLIDRPTPRSGARNKPQPPPAETTTPETMDSEQSPSPDSVINAWELMDGLEDLDSGSDEPVTASGENGSVKNLSQTTATVKSSETKEDTCSVPPLLPDKSSKTVNSSRMYSSFSNHWSKFTGTQEGIVIYFTSLRGIRKTYEDCCLVRMIFRGFRVSVDERDISMDSFFRKELQAKLGGKGASLPQVFIRGNSIGGAEEIKQMNEAGELAKILEGFPVAELGSICHGCGDARFVPCNSCNGSRKLFEEDGGLRRCPDCNENGLTRCPFCCL